jgi:hypothetical protein
MKYDFFVAEKKNYDLINLLHDQELKLVSFSIDVLDKYKNSNFKINLDDDVGTLESLINDEWELQIDVDSTCGYLTTWLYKLCNLPDDEIKHFVKHNIYARELSKTANRRWCQGIP